MIKNSPGSSPKQQALHLPGSPMPLSLCICYSSEHLSAVGKYQFLHPGSTESAAHKSAAFRDSNGDRPIVDARQCSVDTSPSLNRRILGCGLVNYEFAI
jgi:hypothetical protein